MYLLFILTTDIQDILDLFALSTLIFIDYRFFFFNLYTYNYIPIYTVYSLIHIFDFIIPIKNVAPLTALIYMFQAHVSNHISTYDENECTYKVKPYVMSVKRHIYNIGKVFLDINLLLSLFFLYISAVAVSEVLFFLLPSLMYL